MSIMMKIIRESKNEIIKNIGEFKLYLILFFLYIAFFKIMLPHETNCLVKAISGFPCPTCGMTRASFSLLGLNVTQAYQYHPLVFVVPFLFMTVLMKDLYFFATLFRSKVFWSIVIVLFVTVYIVRMYYMFPDTVPMDYGRATWIYKLF